VLVDAVVTSALEHTWFWLLYSTHTAWMHTIPPIVTSASIWKALVLFKVRSFHFLLLNL
jgi:hypothetical protein